MVIQFPECFHTLESEPKTKAVQICRAPPTHKSSQPNINNTDTKDDSDSCNAAVSSSNARMDEWKAYLNTNEDILDGMGIVHWWGVSFIPSHLCTMLILICLEPL